MEKITLYRYGHSKDTIYGNINIHTKEGNVITLQTVENKDKAIKKGTYNINTYSPKFDTNLWTLTVPNRTGIRIHIANRGDQLSGCIALGLFKKKEET